MGETMSNENLLQVYNLLDEIRNRVAGVERVAVFISANDWDIRDALHIQVDTLDDFHMRETILYDDLVFAYPKHLRSILEYYIKLFNQGFNEARTGGR